MNYRNRNVLDEARHHPCQLCSNDDGTVVAAHSNQGRHGKGMSIKANDVFVAYLCARCHMIIDQGSEAKSVREHMWNVAHQRSIPLFAHLLNAEGQQLLEDDRV